MSAPRRFHGSGRYQVLVVVAEMRPDVIDGTGDLGIAEICPEWRHGPLPMKHDGNRIYRRDEATPLLGLRTQNVAFEVVQRNFGRPDTQPLITPQGWLLTRVWNSRSISRPTVSPPRPDAPPVTIAVSPLSSINHLSKLHYKQAKRTGRSVERWQFRRFNCTHIGHLRLVCQVASVDCIGLSRDIFRFS
jgi:hypothetical protein